MMTVVTRSKTGSRGRGRLTSHGLTMAGDRTLCGIRVNVTGHAVVTLLTPEPVTGPVHDCGSCARYAKGNPDG